MRMPQMRLISPDTPALIDAARELFREYAQSLAVDLCFQGFESELAGLPGDYAEPAGALLLVLVDGELAGCGAFRPLPDADLPNACEMKRLYVRPAFRRYGLGRLLAQQLIDQAREASYSRMYLDTLDDMESARELYATLGFHEVAPYYFNPIPGAHYLCVDLDRSVTRY
ncbi:GNAT family N-acetyltransferase [Leptothrix cholodnii]|nr:GNAT family N-acetyltransferase [Leptothrix cholodnii]